MEKNNNFLKSCPENCIQVKEVMFLYAQPVPLFTAFSSRSLNPLPVKSSRGEIVQR